MVNAGRVDVMAGDGIGQQLLRQVLRLAVGQHPPDRIMGEGSRSTRDCCPSRWMRTKASLTMRTSEHWSSALGLLAGRQAAADRGRHHHPDQRRGAARRTHPASGHLAIPHRPARVEPDLDLLWKACLRRFDQEHFHRFAKVYLGMDAAHLISAAATDRWVWLILAAYAQLRIASGLPEQLRRP